MSLLKSGEGPPQGPNLLGKGDGNATEAGGNRILSRLEHGGAAPAAPPARRWRPGWRQSTAVGLAALVVAVLVHEMAGPPAPPLAAREQAPARAAAPAPSLPVPAPPPTEHSVQAATIVNDALPASPAAPAVTVATATSASVPRKAAPPLRQAAARAPASRPAAAAPGDSDVALLTAMVAHAHRQESTASPVRDVVLRQGEEDTASLLQRCKQLGMIEGMLCRSRICSGRWDSDSACR